MIVDKNNGNVVSGNSTNTQFKPNLNPDDVIEVEELSEMPSNGIIDVALAIKEILKNVRWKYNDKNSEKIFKTVQHDGGQYEQIVTGDENPLSELVFPAAFFHFINIRWASNQNTVNEGTAELRIQYVMNTLNNYDDGKDMELYYVGQRIIQTIQEERPNYPCLSKKCKLTFMDTATYFHGGLQSCWLTYDVQFTETNIWVKRHTVRKFIVAPPFTNHSDQKDPILQNPGHHTNNDHQRTYDEASGFVDNLGKSDKI